MSGNYRATDLILPAAERWCLQKCERYDLNYSLIHNNKRATHEHLIHSNHSLFSLCRRIKTRECKLCTLQSKPQNTSPAPAKLIPFCFPPVMQQHENICPKYRAWQFYFPSSHLNMLRTQKRRRCCTRTTCQARRAQNGIITSTNANCELGRTKEGREWLISVSGTDLSSAKYEGIIVPDIEGVDLNGRHWYLFIDISHFGQPTVTKFMKWTNWELLSNISARKDNTPRNS